MSGGYESAKRAAEETKETVDASRKQVRDAVDAIAGEPAEDVAQAERQIAGLRARLERDVSTLRGRLPEQSEVAERGGPPVMLAAGGLAAATIGALVFKRRSSRKARDSERHEQALALARALREVEQDEREQLEAYEAELQADAGGGGGRLALLALLAAGVGVAVWARMRDRGVIQVPDLEEGVREEVAATPDVEGGMVDLSATQDR